MSNVVYLNQHCKRIVEGAPKLAAKPMDVEFIDLTEDDRLCARQLHELYNRLMKDPEDDPRNCW